MVLRIRGDDNEWIEEENGVIMKFEKYFHKLLRLLVIRIGGISLMISQGWLLMI